MQTPCEKWGTPSAFYSAMYLLDTNVFITAKDNYYPLDYCPAFWDWILKGHHNNLLASVVAVRDEILKREATPLAKWVKKLPSTFFLDVTPAMRDAAQQITDWLEGTSYTPSARIEFMDCADSELVAHAIAGGHTVVTFEKSRNKITQIKIPDVCKQFEVPYVNVFEVIRQSGDKFILDPPLPPVPTQGTMGF